MPTVAIITAVLEIIRVLEERAAREGEPVSDELLRAKRDLVNAVADEAQDLTGG
jgi:hypothetical protein